MIHHLHVANIKSDGCVNTICSSLDAIDGVEGTVVNITNGAVFVEANREIRDVLTGTLLKLGYPEISTSITNNSFSTIAKSFVSCVRGRLNHLSTATN